MKKRAFVRYSKNGKVVPGSLILTAGSFPQGPSTWKEVPADLCCDTTCGSEPLLMTITPIEGFFEFGMRVYSNNTVKGTIHWGDGTSEPFDLTGGSGYLYINHTYTTLPDYIPRTVSVYYTSTVGLRNLEIGDGDIIGQLLSISGLQAAFVNSNIQQIDADGNPLTVLDVSGIPVEDLYSLNCDLAHINVTGCTNLTGTELYDNLFQILDFSGCTSLSYADIKDNPNLDTIVIDGCPSLAYLYAANCILTQANVDYILTTLDNNGLTGGLVDLGGSGNAAPSAGVSGIITSLTGKGWAVTTN